MKPGSRPLRRDLLAALLLWLIHAASTQTQTCPGVNKNTYESVAAPIKERGGLSALVDGTDSIRHAILSHDLNYVLVGDEIRKAYTGSELDVSNLVLLALNFCQNILFVGGFFVFVGVGVPCVLYALWFLWECCRHEREEEEEEDNRNFSFKAQVIAWSASLLLYAVLVCQVAFLVVLLIGSSWVAHGVGSATQLVNSTIPLLYETKESTLNGVEEVVLVDYDNLVHQLTAQYLDPIPANVLLAVEEDCGERISDLFHSVESEYETLSSLLAALDEVYLLHLELSAPVLQQAWALTEDLNRLMEACSSAITQETNASQDLRDLCSAFANNGSFLPSPSPFLLLNSTPTTSGDNWLIQLRQELSRQDLFMSEDPFNLFLEELSRNLSAHVNSTSSLYFSSIEANLSAAVRALDQDYQNLTFGWPGSQDELQDYLGPRYLQNWESFRMTCTIFFVLGVVVIVVWLSVVVARGLFNIHAIYRYGDDTAHVEGAHQAGIMIKKLGCSFTVVSTLTAVLFTVLLSLSGLLGHACGPHGNFTAFTRAIVDNPATWGRGGAVVTTTTTTATTQEEDPSSSTHGSGGAYAYLLGELFLDDPRYPLTLESILWDCGNNFSVYQTLRLSERYDVEEIVDISSDGQIHVQYLEDFNFFLVNRIELTADIQLQLELTRNIFNVAVDWGEYGGEGGGDVGNLWEKGFVGLDALQETLKQMHDLAAGSVAPVLQGGFLLHVESAQANLSSLESAVDSFQNNGLSRLQERTAEARGVYGSLAPEEDLSALLETAASLENSVGITTTTASSREVVEAASSVIIGLRDFETAARASVQCDTGKCVDVSLLAVQFSSSVCQDVLQGLDVHWAALFILFLLSLLAVILVLFLTNRFVDVELERRSSRNKTNRISLMDTLVSQLQGTVWLLFSLSVDLWWVVSVEKDEYFHAHCTGEEGAGCCASCVWGFGLTFLLISIIAGSSSQIYQSIIIYQLHKLERSNTRMKARRFWVERKKVVNFYGQLMQFFFQAPQMNTVMLDRAVDSENEDLLRRREEGAYLTNVTGVEVVELNSYQQTTDVDTSTTRSESYYDSNNSMTASDMPGYYSSSQAPDQYSDYMDDLDCDSEYSQQQRYVYHIRGLPEEISVEV